MVPFVLTIFTVAVVELQDFDHKKADPHLDKTLDSINLQTVGMMNNLLYLQDQTERNRLKLYWRHLAAVIFGCVCLFVFEMCERQVKCIS